MDLKYSPMPQAPKKRKRTILNIGISVGVLVVIAGATAFILQTFMGNKDSEPIAQSSEVVLEEVISAEKIIEEYTSIKIESRDSLYTKRDLVVEQTELSEPEFGSKSPQGPTNSTITYVKKGSFSTQVSSSEYVQYQRNDTTIPQNDSALSTSTEAFLISKKLVKTETSSAGGDATYTTYDSKNVVCQVSSVTADNQYPASYGLACVAKEIINRQYTFIDSLVKKVPGVDVSKIKATVVSLPIIEESSQLVTITLTDETETKILYFATQAEDWEYIGQRPVKTPDDETSFVIPSDLSSAIKDPKWGGFLERYIK